MSSKNKLEGTVERNNFRKSLEWLKEVLEEFVIEVEVDRSSDCNPVLKTSLKTEIAIVISHKSRESWDTSQ